MSFSTCNGGPLTFILGCLYCLSLSIFILLSIPVYIFRQVVILLAKCFRPDLGSILNGQSAIFAGDYMAKTTPRSHVVAALIFEGHLTVEDVRERVNANWIIPQNNSGNGQLEYDNFYRYPVKWLGFSFWKDASATFSIDQHVYKFSGMEEQVSDARFTEFMEILLNEKLPKGQSPWEMHVIENYSNRMNNQAPHSILILKFHHCLTDGVGIMHAVASGLFQQRWKKTEPTTNPSSNSPTFSKFLKALVFPFVAFFEVSSIFSHVFRNSPFKISDEHKEWHQVYAKSTHIPIKTIKSIKNKFGVSYASVLLSAMSSAVNKTLVDMGELMPMPQSSADKSMICLNVLPSRGITQRKVLANHMTGALFNLPIVSFDSPAERLIAVNDELESVRNSVIPTSAEWYSSLLGAHTNFLCRRLARNKIIPIGLTNFSVLGDDMEWDAERKWVQTEVVCGAHDGEAGVAVASYSHGEQVTIHVSSEKAVFTRKQSEFFVKCIEEEIESLHLSAPCKE